MCNLCPRTFVTHVPVRTTPRAWAAPLLTLLGGRGCGVSPVGRAWAPALGPGVESCVVLLMRIRWRVAPPPKGGVVAKRFASSRSGLLP